MKKKEFYIKNLNNLKNLASDISKYLSNQDIITLSGDLGSGKTTLVKEIINALTIDTIEVTSPTFNLLNIYNINKIKIWHFDLYRLKNKSEVYELGIEDAFIYGVSLIEWPEIIKDILPQNRLDITLSFTDTDSCRIITLSGQGKWYKIISDQLL